MPSPSSHNNRTNPSSKSFIAARAGIITLLLASTIAACIFFPYALVWCQSALVGTGVNLLAHSTIITLAAQTTITFCGIVTAWRTDNLLQAWHNQCTSRMTIQQQTIPAKNTRTFISTRPNKPHPHAFFTSPGHLTFSANTKVITSSMLASIPKDQVKTVSIPAGVATIGNFAFSNFIKLTQLDLPASITTMKAGAFSGCTGLKNLDFPNDLTTIEALAFQGCHGLTRLIFPDSLTTIGFRAFDGCTGLTHITFPDSLTDIQIGAFFDCTGLTSVTFPSTANLTSITRSNFYHAIGLPLQLSSPSN